jgi:hypothetical protein
MHTTVEMVHKEDVENVISLIYHSCCSSRQAMISGTFGNPWQKSYINKIRTGIGSSTPLGGPIFVSSNKPKYYLS